MTSTEKLHAVANRLTDRGVVDIKVFLAEGAAQMPRSKVENDVAAMLEQYLDGNYKPLPPLGDLPPMQ